MKGTLSSTGFGHKLIAHAAQAGQSLAPVCHLPDTLTHSFRENAPNSTRYFLACLRSVTPDHPLLPKMPLSHIRLTWQSSSASIRPMAKTHKSSTGSSSRSKGTGRGKAKLQKKKAFPPPPPAQPGGVD